MRTHCSILVSLLVLPALLACSESTTTDGEIGASKSALVGGWDPIAEPANKVLISAIAVHPINQDIVWVAYGDGSLYRTFNGRSSSPTWTKLDDVATPGALSLPNRRITNIALGLNDTKTAYVGFVGGDTVTLWKTANGGQTWLPLNEGGYEGWSVTGISVNPDDEANVTVNNNVDITYVSNDYGQTFTSSGWNPPGQATWSKLVPVDTTAELTAVAVAPGNRNEVWAGFSNGELYQTSNVASVTPNWSRVDYDAHFGRKSPKARIQSIAFPPNRYEGQTYVSYEVVNGINSAPLWSVTATTSGWGVSAVTNPLPEKGILGVAVHPQSASELHVATDFGVLQSTDFGSTWPTDDRALRAKYRDGGNGSINEASIRAHLKIENVGNEAVNLAELELRYYYSIDAMQNTSEQVWLDYATLGTTKVAATTKYNYTGGPAAPPADADHYLSVTFPAEAGLLQPGTDSGEIQYRVNKVDWSGYDQSNDQSFDVSKTTYADSWRVALYRNGQLVWGVTP